MTQSIKPFAVAPIVANLQSAVFLNDYCHINGGASRVAIDEAIALANQGVSVTFLGANGPICPELEESRVSVVCLGQAELIKAGANPGVYVQSLWNLPAYRAMEEILSALDPARTVVHLHGYTKCLTTSPVRAAIAKKFSVVCTLHDFFVACPNGAFFDYVANAPCERRGLSTNCFKTNCDKRAYVHKAYRFARSLIQKWPGQLPSGVVNYISLSRRSAEILKPYLSPRSRIHPLENIVSVEKKTVVDVSRNTKLVAVGRLDREKGCELLVAAAEQAGVHITFVGDGALRITLQKSSNVTVTGWLSPAEVQAELDTARALIFPSLWFETYGLVVAEAAGRGVPAVVSDISAASERITSGIQGLVFQGGDVDSLAAALKKLNNDTLVKNMGLAAYDQFWMNPPTSDRHIDELKIIYEKTLAQRGVA